MILRIPKETFLRNTRYLHLLLDRVSVLYPSRFRSISPTLILAHTIALHHAHSLTVFAHTLTFAQSLTVFHSHTDAFSYAHVSWKLRDEFIKAFGTLALESVFVDVASLIVFAFSRNSLWRNVNGFKTMTGGASGQDQRTILFRCVHSTFLYKRKEG